MNTRKITARSFTRVLLKITGFLPLLVVLAYIVVTRPLATLQEHFELQDQRQDALVSMLRDLDAARSAQQAYLLSGQLAYRRASVSALDALAERASAFARIEGTPGKAHPQADFSVLVPALATALEQQTRAYERGQAPEALLRIPDTAAQQLTGAVEQLLVEQRHSWPPLLRHRNLAWQIVIGLLLISLLATYLVVRDLLRLRRKMSESNQVTHTLKDINKNLEQEVDERIAALTATNDRLRHQEALLNEAQHVALVGSIDWDARTDLISCTDEFFRLWGLEPGSVSPSRELYRRPIHAADRLKVGVAWQAALRGERSYDVEFRISGADGEERWIHARGNVTADAHLVPLHFSGTVQDVTQRKQQEEQISTLLDRLQLATDSASVGIWERNIITGEPYWDGMMFRLYGIEPCEPQQIPRAWIERVHPDDRKNATTALSEAMLGADIYDQIFRIILPTDEQCWIKAHADVYRDAGGKPVRMVGVNWDITELVLAQQAATDSRDVALHANAAKDVFLATMSHELRTPMNSVLGLLELLPTAPSGEPQAGIVEAAIAAGQALLRIIDDMLDQESIANGTLLIRTSPVSIAALLRHSYILYAPQAKAKGLALTLDIDTRINPLLLADPARISQILSNLLSNAVRYCDSGSVDIRAGLLEASDDSDTLSITVAVSGNGSCMDEQTRRRLFESDEPCGLEGRLHDDTALGLSLTRKLVQMMGGTISAEGSPGHGSNVRIMLTLAHATDTDLPEHPAERPVACVSEGAVLVLGVDDHPSNRKLLAHQLAQLGVKSQIAESGEQALELWRATRFTLLLVDLNMPGMNGFALARAIRETEARDALARTPIIAWTANLIDGTPEHCHAAGMDELLTKPTSLDDLQRTLAKWSLPDQMTAPPVAPIAAAAPADRVAPVDTRVLAALIGDDIPVMREFLLDFRESGARIAREMAAAGAQAQPQDAASLAHKLKSSARAVGALALGDLCALIEQAGKAGDNQTVAELLGRFDIEWLGVRIYIDEHWGAEVDRT